MPKRASSTRHNPTAKKKQRINGSKKREAESETGDGNHHETSKSFDFSSSKNLFNSFIHPLKEETFFQKHWEKQPLLLKDSRCEIAKACSSLFSRKTLEDILRKNEVEYIRDVCVSRYVDEERENLNKDGRVTVKELKNVLDKQQATLQFHQPQRFQNELWQIMEKLESFFGCLVGANIYMTPAGSQGLAPHYDDVEVFILQLEGEKHWRLYSPPTELPRDYSEDLSEAEIGEPTHDIILKQGDLLYFPRGTVHQADTPTTCTHSTHITFSTYQQHTWGDYISKSLLHMAGSMYWKDVAYRQGLPRDIMNNYLPFKSTPHRPHIKNLLEGVLKELEASHQQTVQAMQLDFIANRLPPYHAEGILEEFQMPNSKRCPTHTRLKQLGHTCIHVIDKSQEKNAIFTRQMIGSGTHNDDEDNGDDGESEEEEEDSEDEEMTNTSNGGGGDRNGGDRNGASSGDSEKDGWFYVLNSFYNDRRNHMMAVCPTRPPGYLFPPEFLEAFQILHQRREEWVPVSDLKIEMKTLTSLMFADLVEYKYDT